MSVAAPTPTSWRATRSSSVHRQRRPWPSGPASPARPIDAAARSVITDAGYGDRFIHRTGHGIGLEVHEEPYIVAGNAEPLQVGHAFSIEPGIYVDGRDGARIEDIVVCGADGADAMNRSSRDLYVVTGA